MHVYAAGAEEEQASCPVEWLEWAGRAIGIEWPAG